MKKKIFTVTYIEDSSDDFSFATSEIFATKEEAIKFINEEFASKVKDLEIETEKDEIQMEEYDEDATEAYIYHYGNIYKWSLFWKTLKI